MDYTFEYAKRREKMQFQLRLRRNEIYEKYPNIADIESKHALLQAKRIQNRDETIKNEIEQNRNDLKLALKAIKLNENYLNLQHYCDKCQDYGVLGQGKLCTCKNKLIEDENRLESCLNADFTFENFDLRLFEIVSQRSDMARLKDTLFKCCQDIKNGDKKNILLHGAVGLGKTYLLHCCGNKLLKTGFKVRYITAMKYIQLILSEVITNKKTTELYKLYDIDILIIDDIGAETKIPNITEQYMLSLIDTRLNTNKNTFFATNATARQLIEFYGDRVVSRMLQNNNTLKFVLKGDDIRLKIQK